jgi:beta-lactamase class A
MTAHHAYAATAPAALTVAEGIAWHREQLGMSGHFLARNVDTGEELGFDVETAIPLCVSH